MFFFYILLILSLALMILIINTTIKIHIENLKIAMPKINKRNINKNYKITLKFYILNKFKYLKLDITKTKMEKKFVRKNVDKIKKKIEEGKNKIDIKALKNLKKIKWKLEQINLEIYIGHENTAINAIIVGILSSLISITLGNLKNNKNLPNSDKNSTFWKIVPLYQNKNLIEIKLNTILEIKIKDILKFIILKKTLEYKN